MKDRKLKLVSNSAPKGKRVFKGSTKGGVSFRGSDENRGDTRFVCAKCDYILAEKVSSSKSRGVVMICPKCESVNDADE